MKLELTDAARETRRVREWRRSRAVLPRAEGQTSAAVARTLQVSEASMSTWVLAWRQRGLAGVREEHHSGLARRLEAAGEAWLDGLLRVWGAAHGS